VLAAQDADNGPATARLATWPLTLTVPAGTAAGALRELLAWSEGRTAGGCTLEKNGSNGGSCPVRLSTMEFISALNPFWKLTPTSFRK
jgi:hypothetical protein